MFDNYVRLIESKEKQQRLLDLTPHQSHILGRLILAYDSCKTHLEFNIKLQTKIFMDLLEEGIDFECVDNDRTDFSDCDYEVFCDVMLRYMPFWSYEEAKEVLDYFDCYDRFPIDRIVNDLIVLRGYIVGDLYSSIESGKRTKEFINYCEKAKEYKEYDYLKFFDKDSDKVFNAEKDFWHFGMKLNLPNEEVEM